MSRSKRLPIYKDGSSNSNKVYLRKIRRRINQEVRNILALSDKESYELPSPKVLVNDYDWSDYIIRPGSWYSVDIKKMSRK